MVEKHGSDYAYLSIFRWVLKKVLNTLEVHSIFLGWVNILGMSDLRDLWRSHSDWSTSTVLSLKPEVRNLQKRGSDAILNRG